MILLDTHAWLWWVSDPDQLSKKARKRIDKARKLGSVYISSMSCWELAAMLQTGHLKLDRPVANWIGASQRQPFIHFIPVDNALAIEAMILPEAEAFDPVDRILVATARRKGLALVTKDKYLRNYPHIQTYW